MKKLSKFFYLLPIANFLNLIFLNNSFALNHVLLKEVHNEIFSFLNYDDQRTLKATSKNLRTFFKEKGTYKKVKGQLIGTYPNGLFSTYEHSADEILLATEDANHNVKIFSTKTGLVLDQLSGHSDKIHSASFSIDKKFLVTASSDSTAKIWDLQKGNLLHNLSGHINEINNASFSSDGKLVVTASDDGTAKIWNAQTGELLQNLTGHTGKVFSASFSPDAKLVVTASEDKTSRIWDVKNGKLKKFLMGHLGAVIFSTFSPNGEFVVTTSIDQTVKIRNSKTGQVIHDLYSNHEYPKIISQAFFSNDGRFLATVCKDGTSDLWDAHTGRQLMRNDTNFVRFDCLTFSSNVKFILSACPFYINDLLNKDDSGILNTKNDFISLDFINPLSAITGITFYIDKESNSVTSLDRSLIIKSPNHVMILNSNLLKDVVSK